MPARMSPRGIKVVPLNVRVTGPMRGGETTGSFALESALDELSYKLGIDPIDLQLRNYAEMDPGGTCRGRANF